MDSSRVMCLRHCLISGRLALWTRNDRLWARTARGFQCAAAAQTAGTAQPAKQKGSNNNVAKAGVENTSSESDQKALRLEKIEQLRSTGVEPFAYSFGVSHTATELQQTYQDLPNGELADLDGSPIAVAGRIMTRRFLGKKLAFFTLQDATGTIQLYIEKGLMESDSPMPFGDLKQVLDNGDIIGVQGGMKRTDKGELSVAAKSIHMLTKSLLPLPEKYYGFGEDTENRFRNRYVDMIVTEGVRAALRTRAQVSVCMRRVLDEQGFIEIETPMLEASAGGADARPFVTWHNALQRPYVLRIATELRLKRCLVGGFDKVYEIGRIFRNEGLSSRHNPEFTSIELYQAFVDYHAMMDLTEHLIRSCAKAAFPAGISSIPNQEHTLDLEAPFRKASMQELVQEATGLDFLAFSGDVEAAKAAASEMLERRAGEVPEGDQQSSVASSRKNVAQASSVGEVLNECFEACVEQTLTQPTFVLDHPVEISPLAKAHRSKPGCVERFELFVAGRELANAFSELTDPVEQRRRLEAQVTAHRRAGGAVPSDDAQPSSSASAGGFGGSQEAPYEVTVDEDFLRALEVGMPPAAGMGLGIDRLVMLLTNASSIKEVIAFPLMR